MDGTARQIRYPFEMPPPEAAATEIAPGILWLRLPLPMALDHVNIYALDDTMHGGDGWTVIDTGLASKTTKAIWEALLAGPLAAKPVSRVVVTHHHPDHVGLAGWFVDRGAELLTTRTAWLMTRMLCLDEQPSYPPETVGFYRRAGMAADVLAKRLTERPFNFADCVAPLPLGFTRLQQGDSLRMAGRDWIVRMGHGHAPEQATFWSLDDHLVLGADQLLPSISPNIGVYPSEPEADPLGEWLTSCADLMQHANNDHLVLGGHKLPFTGLPFRLQQMIDNHLAALDRLHAHLATPQTGGDCFAPLFKREIGAGEYGLALVETLAHLNHLQQQGRVTRWLDADGAHRWQAV